jgi:DNA mismatch repair ATPase MutS
VPVSFGAQLQSSRQFEYAGHGSSPSTILIHSPALQAAAAAHAAAAAACADAAAAAVGAATAQLLAKYSPLSALIQAVAELDVLAGFAAVTDAASTPSGVSFSRPVFAAAAAGGGGGGGATGLTPPMHFKGLW